jgi:hypothetical protein
LNLSKLKDWDGLVLTREFDIKQVDLDFRVVGAVHDITCLLTGKIFKRGKGFRKGADAAEISVGGNGLP